MRLAPAERKILIDLLVHGDNTSGNIAENIEGSRTHVSETLGKLEGKDLVEDKGRGVYRLTLAGTAAARDLYRE